MTRRSCATCKYYERSSIPRMGWCRHPELYGAEQNHLVSADDLDCNRGLGDYWEPDIATGPAMLPMATPDPNRVQPPIMAHTSSGAPVYPVSGSSGYGDPPPPSSGEGGGPPWGGNDRDFNYYEEERYWTDYLRIAAPILGVIVLVILLWFWIANFLGDDNGDDDDTAGQTTATETLPTEAATEGEPGDATGTASPPSETTQPPSGPTATTAPNETEDPGGGNGEPTEIYLGATVQVANTDGAGVNVRADPSTEAEVLTVFLDGTQIEVIDGPVEAEGFTWWQITGNEVEAGWVVDDFLEVLE